MPFCEVCNDRYFGTQESLRQHWEDSPKRHPYCKPCDRYFVNDDALQQHRRTSSKHDYCSICERSFVDYHALQQHLENSPVHRRSRNRRNRSGSSCYTPTSSILGDWMISPSPSVYACPGTPSSATVTVPASSPTSKSPTRSTPQQLHLIIPDPTPVATSKGTVVGLAVEEEKEGQLESEKPRILLKDVVLPSDISTPISPAESDTETKALRTSCLEDAVLPSDISSPISPAGSSGTVNIVETVHPDRTTMNPSPTPTSATSETLIAHFGFPGDGREQADPVQVQPQLRVLVNGKDVVLQSDISTPVLYQQGVDDGVYNEVDEDEDEEHEEAVDPSENSDHDEEEVDMVSSSQMTIRPSRIPTMHSPDPSPASSVRTTPCHSPPPPQRPPRKRPVSSANTIVNPAYEQNREREEEQRRVAQEHPPSDPGRESSSNTSSPDMRFEELHGLPQFSRSSGGEGAENEDDDTSPLASLFEKELRRYSTPLLESKELTPDGDEEHERRDATYVDKHEGEFGHVSEEEINEVKDELCRGYDQDVCHQHDDHSPTASGTTLPFLDQDPYLLSDVSPPYSTPLARRRPSSMHSSAGAGSSSDRGCNRNRNVRIVENGAYLFEVARGDDVDEGEDEHSESAMTTTVSFFDRFAPPESSQDVKDSEHLYDDAEYYYDDGEEEGDYVFDEPYEQDRPFVASGIQVGPGRRVTTIIEEEEEEGEDDEEAQMTPMLLTVSRGGGFRYPYPFQLSLPPIPEREWEHETQETEEAEEEAGASIHTMNSEEEAELVRSGGMVVYRADSGTDSMSGGAEMIIESPITDMAIFSPHRMGRVFSEGGDESYGSDAERESIACPSPSLSPLQSPRLDELAQAICDGDVEPLNLMSMGIDARQTLSVALDETDEMDIMRINVDDAIDYYDDHVVEGEGDPFTDLARISMSGSDMDASYGYGYGYSPVDPREREESGSLLVDDAVKPDAIPGPSDQRRVVNAPSSPTDEFFSARDSFVDTTPGTDSGAIPALDGADGLAVERVDESLSLLQQVGIETARPMTWIDYPEPPPISSSTSQSSDQPLPTPDDENASRGQSPLPRVSRTIPVPTTDTLLHSRSNSSRSITPQGFLLSLGMYGNAPGESLRASPEIVEHRPQDEAGFEGDDQMQDFLDLESRCVSQCVSPQVIAGPLDSESASLEGHVVIVTSEEAESLPHVQRIHIDSNVHHIVTPGPDNVKDANTDKPQVSPCSPYIQQTPISIRSSALQDYSGASAVGDIPSEEESLTWDSARSLREACLKKVNHAEHSGHWEGKADLVADEVRECLSSDDDLTDTDEDATLNTSQIRALADSHVTLKRLDFTSPAVCQRVDSVSIPASAADTELIQDEPSIISDIPSSPLTSVPEIPSSDDVDVDSQNLSTVIATEFDTIRASSTTPLGWAQELVAPPLVESAAKSANEEFAQSPRRETSVMHCRICRADPCIETTATFCGHIFCYDCITREVMTSSKCPVCRTPTLLYCLFKLDLSC